MDESNNVINRKGKYLSLKEKILKLLNLMIKLYYWKKKKINNNWNKYVPVLYCHDFSHKYVIKLTEFFSHRLSGNIWHLFTCNAFVS